MLKYKVQRTTAYAATTLTLSTVFHLKPRCHANMVTLDTPTCSTCSERFPAWLSHPKPNEFLCFDLESCNLMCTYTVVTHPCHMPPLAQARPMMLCIYTSWGEPERAPHRRYSWEISYIIIIIIIIIIVRPSPARRGWSHEVCRASVTARGSRYTARKVLYCQTVSVLVLLL